MTDKRDEQNPQEQPPPAAEDVEEFPEERPRVATAPPPSVSRHLLAETVMEFPEDDDQIRRSQIDFDGEVGRDRV